MAVPLVVGAVDDEDLEAMTLVVLVRGACVEDVDLVADGDEAGANLGAVSLGMARTGGDSRS